MAPIIRSNLKRRAAKLPPVEKTPEVSLPANMVDKVPSARALSSGAYQKKLMRLFAPTLLPGALNCTNRNLRGNNQQAANKVMEAYGVLQAPRGATTIIAPQFNNENRADAVAQAAELAGRKQEEARGLADFEAMMRLVEDGRKTISLEPTQYEATPEGAAE